MADLERLRERFVGVSDVEELIDEVERLRLALKKSEERIVTIAGALERDNIKQARIWAGLQP